MGSTAIALVLGGVVMATLLALFVVGNLKASIDSWPDRLEVVIEPTPAPGEPFRALAVVTEANDTDTGDDTGNEYDSPLASLADIYPWVDASLFHPADRVGLSRRELVMPGCIDQGEPDQRYLLLTPSQPPLQRLAVSGGNNQVDDWPLAATITPGTLTYDLRVSLERLDCRAVGAQVLELYP